MDCQCHHGFIHLIIGPMFSGKTTELFRLTKRYNLANRKVVIVKYKNDTRYDAMHACTHDFNKMEALNTTSLSTVFEKCLQCDVIAIDEGQFFDKIEYYANKLANQNKIVIIAALNSDFRQQPFKNVISLIPMAEKIKKLSAVCACGQTASFTVRLTSSTELELIGGTEKYQAICRTCLNSGRYIKDRLPQQTD